MMRYFIPALVAAFVLSGTPVQVQHPSFFKGANAYVKMNETTMTWRIGNDVVERIIQFDRDKGGLKTLQITSKAGPHITISDRDEANFTTAPVSEGQRREKEELVTLEKDWAYIWHIVNTPDHQGRRLTIHLQGIRSHLGLEVEVIYEVYPGNRPYLAKWITLINRSPMYLKFNDVRFDRLALTRQGKVKPFDFQKQKEDNNVYAQIYDMDTKTGLIASIQDSRGTVDMQNGSLVQLYSFDATTKPDGDRVSTPRSVLVFYSGDSRGGMELYRNYADVIAPVPVPILRR